MIELREVRKTFNAGTPAECAALSGVTLTIPANTVTVLTGPSGSGKTTLLTIVGCMARPSAGRVRLDGREITSLPERFLTDIRRRRFGFIFQQPSLIPGLTVLENVMLPAYPLGERRAALQARAMRALASYEISAKAPAKVQWLSGGEAQRVAIVRALINDPAVVIADEPTAHLDTTLARRFMQVIARFKDEGKTVLISSHDPRVSSSPVVDQVVALRDGRIEGDGPSSCAPPVLEGRP